AMELGPVEELAEDLRDLGLDDPGPVVLDDDEEASLALGELRLPGLGLQREVVDLDVELGQDPRLLAGVERVVDRLLDGGQERLGRVVEAEEMAVLGEELGDGDLALLRGHALGGAPTRRSSSSFTRSTSSGSSSSSTRPTAPPRSSRAPASTRARASCAAWSRSSASSSSRCGSWRRCGRRTSSASATTSIPPPGSSPS